MHLQYDAERIQRLLTDFTNITHIDISFLDRNMQRVAECVGYGSFCSLLQKQHCGEKQCVCSDRALLERCRKSNAPEIHICHAGLVDIAVPVMKDSVVLGYLIFGRIRTAKAFDSVFQRVSWITGDYDTLRSEYERLVHYDDSQIESIVNLVTAMTALILSLELIQEEYNTLTDKLIAYIDKNLSTDLSVDLLCREINISKNVLYEKFHGDFHCTVTEYITLKRIEKAKHLLQNSNLRISEIAEQTGIGDYTYFFKLMKKYTGMTPTQYRRTQHSTA